ncbi:MAG: phosphoglucosamine mutase, partial [Acidimicrobiales bacterium]
MTARDGPPRFGTDGLRGVANSELTPEVALALGRAAARHLDGGPFLVGRDTRRSGPMLQSALSAGLASEGRDVVDVGVIPTPGLAFLAASKGQPAAMISASHNPYEDNGIKLFGPGGAKLSVAVETAVHDELDRLFHAEAGQRSGGEAGSAGEICLEPGRLSSYEDRLASIGLPIGDWRSRRRGGDHSEIVLDCANGAASSVVPRLLGRLRIPHRTIFASPDGTNINAGCGSTHPEAVMAEVVERGAALGLAFDGDADRVLAVDHEGKLVDGDQLIAMFAADLHVRGLLRGDQVVVTVMSNLGLRRALEALRIGVVETPVGDRHVADAMEEGGLVLGGEQSGHLIFSEYATTGDGIMTALLLLELLSRRQCSLAELAASSMTRLPQVLHNVSVAEPGLLAGAPAVWEAVGAAEAELGPDGRILLRASGTESCVR